MKPHIILGHFPLPWKCGRKPVIVLDLPLYNHCPEQPMEGGQTQPLLRLLPSPVDRFDFPCSVLQEFSAEERDPVKITEGWGVMFACSPPPHYPGKHHPSRDRQHRWWRATADKGIPTHVKHAVLCLGGSREAGLVSFSNRTEAGLLTWGKQAPFKDHLGLEDSKRGLVPPERTQPLVHFVPFPHRLILPMAPERVSQFHPSRWEAFCLPDHGKPLHCQDRGF